MAVLNRHHSNFKSEQRQEIRKAFKAILNDQLNPLPASVDLYRLYGGEVLAERPETVPWVIDWEQRKISDHAHCHLRPSAFPNTSHWELI